MRILWCAVRVTAAVAVLVAVGATLAVAVRPVNPFNFFGYFTIQSNLVAAAAFLVGSVGAARGRVLAPLFRAAATTYIALTGVVYNTLLAGLEGGVALLWANLLLHTVVPLVAAVDWLVASDRPPLPWRRIWVVVPYPLVWLAVVLVRGATDGWVPYPFLNPAHGYGPVAAACALVTAIVLALAAAVWAASRVRTPLLAAATG